MLLTERQANRVVLYDISWQQFNHIIDNLGESRGARVAYDRGVLEIMNPLPEHEYYKEVFSEAIKETSKVLDINYESLGSTTWRKESSLAGVEADNCFYFQNEALVRGKLEFDLDEDPPPDLVLEIDLTSKSLSRFPIYARLGVPEIWCYNIGNLLVYQLKDQEYIEVEISSVFPMLKVQDLPAIIEENRSAGRRAIHRAVREWASRNT
ncbi:MAG: Uma2 family endonuclease [Spirulinaceae cyanobacterium]